MITFILYFIPCIDTSPPSHSLRHTLTLTPAHPLQSIVSGLSEISTDSGLHLNEGQTHQEGEEEERGAREVFQDEEDGQHEAVQVCGYS